MIAFPHATTQVSKSPTIVKGTTLCDRKGHKLDARGLCSQCHNCFVLCRQVGGSHCSICHAHFGDGDDICAYGHQIGQLYNALEVR